MWMSLRKSWSLALAMSLLLSGGTRAASVRQEAEAAALDDARTRLRDQVLTTRLDKDWTVGSLLSRLKGQAAVDRALRDAEQPGACRWLDERSCQVILRVPAGKVVDALLPLVSQARDPQLDARWLRRVTAGWGERDFSTVGSNTPAPASRTPPPASLPQKPPRWADGLLDAEAVAKSADGRLKTARLAEREAAAVLRQKVRDLEIRDGKTLGDFADTSQEAARAVENGLRSARVYKTDYRADGSVLVRMSLNLRVLWAELEQAR
jgi:hypothetical protein